MVPGLVLHYYSPLESLGKPRFIFVFPRGREEERLKKLVEGERTKEDS